MYVIQYESLDQIILDYSLKKAIVDLNSMTIREAVKDSHKHM